MRAEFGAAIQAVRHLCDDFQLDGNGQPGGRLRLRFLRPDAQRMHRLVVQGGTAVNDAAAKPLMVSRWTPVMRSMVRMNMPSVRATTISICLSRGRIFTGPIRHAEGRGAMKKPGRDRYIRYGRILRGPIPRLKIRGRRC
jgi:hypothetical protein